MPWGGVRKLRGRLARYGAAVAAVGVVLLLKILLDPLTGNESPFLLFFAAVMVAALLGGLGAGLLATVLAVLINWFVFLEPAYSLRILEPEQGLRLLLFALEGTLISALVAAMHVARERAEADRGSLALSEERYRAVVEQSTEGIFLLDAESLLILESNPAMQRMFGYTPEELHGMELYELVAHSRGDVDEAVGQTLRERRRLVGERRYRRKDGTLLDVEVGAGTITYNGHHAICAVVRDITSRKRAEEALARSEERFRALVRYASDIIVIVDESGAVLYESPAVERVLGFTPEERVGTNAFDYLHPDDREAVAERFSEIIDEPGGRVSVECRVRHARGDWRHFEAVGVNMLDDPVMGGIVINSRDVTDRKVTEQTLAEIREAERTRIARELHDGVLQDLSYTAQAMEVTRVKYEEGWPIEDELEEEAEAVRRGARELREAVYDLRAFQPGDRGLLQLIESLVELNRGRDPGCDMRFEPEVGALDDLPESVGLELLRVVQEALTNVRRHSEARHARVAIGSSADGTWVEISDGGRGFDPDGASGMGTLGMQERAAALGGRLRISSEPGAGTTVRFEIPQETYRS